ncbi:MAG: hypothetical protein KME09_00855 [Pleurocapsa minor HA4230-MV1]|nr:hypothetical protein [Pleurocapsa minor HA4230-MV1]
MKGIATRKKSRLIKGSLAATLQASHAVDNLQEAKLQNGNNPNFCYFSDIEENWNDLVEQENSSEKFASSI